jgi:hypothetical protein
MNRITLNEGDCKLEFDDFIHEGLLIIAINTTFMESIKLFILIHT